jgi:hypothetical protein
MFTKFSGQGPGLPAFGPVLQKRSSSASFSASDCPVCRFCPVDAWHIQRDCLIGPYSGDRCRLFLAGVIDVDHFLAAAKSIENPEFPRDEYGPMKSGAESWRVPSAANSPKETALRRVFAGASEDAKSS